MSLKSSAIHFAVSKNIYNFALAFHKKAGRLQQLPFGEMVEWSITAVLKTAVLRGTGGSNPSLSADRGVNQIVTRFTPLFAEREENEYSLHLLVS